MDPLTAAGALASAVQLFDISLRYSHEACKFLSALKHSREDGAMLERTVREVDVLIRSLRMYAAEHQRSSAPSSIHHAMLQRSITHISQHFANDMTALYKVLPRDLSTSMLNRVKFVIRRSETDKLLQRLEQRKSAATMALGIIGRMDDIQLRAGISSLENRLLEMSVEQNVALENHSRSLDTANSESQRRETEIIASLQELHNMIVQTNQEGSHCKDLLTTVQSDVSRMISLQNDSLASCQTLETAVQTNTHAITMFREAQTAGITTAISNLEAASIDALVRLVRAELRQQVEPILNNINGVTERLDNIVMDIGHKANAESLFGTRECTSISPDPKEKVEESPPSEFSPSEPDTKSTRSRGSKEIPLFSYKLKKTITGAVTLSIRLRTYRIRGQINVDSQTRFFNLQVDMIPKPWLSSKGLSAFYSSAPDHRGYYSICPSILPFNIIDGSHDVVRLLCDDDLQGFRKMLQRGQLGIRDRSVSFDLHQEALFWGAHSISLYLLRDSGYGKDFVEQNSGDADFDISQLMTHMRPTYNSFETCTSILSSYKDFLPEGKFIDISVPMGWDWFSETFRETSGSCTGDTIGFEVVNFTRVLLRYGVRLQPFVWLGGRWLKPDDDLLGNLQRDIFLMKLYIETGGSPNSLDEDRKVRYPAFGWAPPLLLALDKVVMAWVGDGSEEEASESGGRQETQSSQDNGGGEKRSGDSVGFSGDNSTREESSESMEAERDNDKRDEISALSIELLSVLISAGADVHYIHDDPSWVTVFTLTDFAEGWGIQHILAAALERCELNFAEVKLESSRRLANYHKLRGARRTGIDVEPLIQTGSSNIRQRTPRQVEEVD
ncbi:hypothetical protein QBC37DRAFT_351380 [Rhypophila decipiens]|uniref:Fungal N-terminal domain-containing protein n=1 Tax=Rhypophila decipiens TaxID=261697 RepID=A0AAN7B3L6_9PEZI|nr:hypothetical protein QBC37DRAFT_351380 [Rhypophila decipiens]